MRVLYGGTFDPVHEGHLALARAARDALDAPVFLLPSADPPHRAPPQASASHRAAMLRLAVREQPRLCVDERELSRGERSYTVRSLEEVRAEVGSTEPIVFVLGADAFLGLDQWHRCGDLFALASFLVIQREGSAVEVLPSGLSALCEDRRVAGPADLARVPAGRWCTWPMSLHPASSTAIRAALASGGIPADLPQPVAQYITAHGLYR